ncbi:MAG: hypothetical protein LBQ54_06530 [Planctomycetaceae bacterium]|nr:hypothetical protein [Planctomycetaceae bacterium]
MTLENTDISLISGFPRVEFENSLSLLSPGTTLSSFFNGLANASRPEQYGSSHIMTQQMAVNNHMSMSDVDTTGSPRRLLVRGSHRSGRAGITASGSSKH